MTYSVNKDDIEKFMEKLRATSMLLEKLEFPREIEVDFANRNMRNDRVKMYTLGNVEIGLFQFQGPREKMEDNCGFHKKGDIVTITLSDGVGGHKGGKSASKEVIEITEKIKFENIEDYIKKINDRVVAKEECGYATLANIFIDTKKREVLYLNSGDSRIYQIKSYEERLEQLSVDHTNQKELMEEGLDEQTARFFCSLNSCIGLEHPKYHAGIVKCPEDDVFVLTTDGADDVLRECSWEKVVKLKYGKIIRRYLLECLENNINRIDDNATLITIRFLGKDETFISKNI